MTSEWIIFLGHGSRDPRWTEPLGHLQERVDERCPDKRVQLAFLQHSSPSLEECFDYCMNCGGKDVLIVPLFISAGGHIFKDLPKLIEEVSRKFPDLKILTSDALYEAPEVQDALVEATLRLAQESFLGHSRESRNPGR